MIRLPDESGNSLALADWVELSLLVSSNDVLRISDAEIVGELTDAGLDAEGDRGSITAEIASRSAILGDAYPFARDGQGEGGQWQSALGADCGLCGAGQWERSARCDDGWPVDCPDHLRRSC